MSLSKHLWKKKQKQSRKDDGLSKVNRNSSISLLSLQCYVNNGCGKFFDKNYVKYNGLLMMLVLTCYLQVQLLTSQRCSALIYFTLANLSWFKYLASIFSRQLTIQFFCIDSGHVVKYCTEGCNRVVAETVQIEAAKPIIFIADVIVLAC